MSAKAVYFLYHPKSSLQIIDDPLRLKVSAYYQHVHQGLKTRRKTLKRWDGRMRSCQCDEFPARRYKFSRV